MYYVYEVCAARPTIVSPLSSTRRNTPRPFLCSTGGSRLALGLVMFAHTAIGTLLSLVILCIKIHQCIENQF